MAGNRPEDDRSRIGLNDAVRSLIDFIAQNDLADVRLVGHSYAGMVIAKAVDEIPDRIQRLVFWNAFVPRSGERMNDLMPPSYVQLFEQLAAADNTVMLPFPIWREAFINDADLALAEAAYNQLNPRLAAEKVIEAGRD